MGNVFLSKLKKLDHTEQSLLQLSNDELVRLVLDDQGKFNSVLWSLKDDVRELKSKLNVLESELQFSKNVKDSLTKHIKINHTRGWNV